MTSGNKFHEFSSSIMCVCACVHAYTRIVNRPSEDKVQSETAVCYQSKAAKLVNNNEIKGRF